MLATHLLINDNKIDVALERSAFFRSILLSIDATSNQHVVIIKPSPMLILKWLMTPWLQDYPVTFVLKDQSTCNLFAKSKHVQGTKVEFFDYTKMFEKRWRTQKLKKATTIAFNNSHKPYSKLVLSNLLQPFIEKQVLSNGCRIVALFARQSELDTSSPANLNIMSHFSLNALCFLPTGIPYSTPYTKFIIQASFIASGSTQVSEDIEVVFLKRGKSQNKLCLSPNKSDRFFGRFDWERVGYAYNRLLRITRTESGTTKKRKAPKVLSNFGPNIRFTLSASAKRHRKSLFTLRSYLPAPPKKLLRGGLDKGEYIESTVKKLLRLTDSSIVDLIVEYLQMEVDAGEGLVSIRHLIASAFQNHPDKLAYTLREYWLIHPGIDNQMDTNLAPFLYKFMFSDTADVLIADTDAVAIEEAIDELLPEKRGIAAKSVVLDVIIQCIEHAQQNNYIQDNPFEQLDDDGLPSVRNVFAEVLNALRPHSLTLVQQGELQNKLRLHKDDIRYLAMWLQLETGADYREICALCWECLVYDEIMKIHNILIDRQVNANGEPVSQARLPRPMEISRELAQALCLLKSSVSASLPDCACILSRRIFQPDYSTASLQPRVYKAHVYAVLSPFLPEDRHVLLANLYGQTKHLKLTWDSIDVLRHNYEFHGRTHNGLTDGESRFSRGLTQRVVLYRSYVDLGNPFSINQVGIKNKRIIASADDTLNCDELIPQSENIAGREIITKTQSSYASPSRSIIRLDIPANTHVQLLLKNQHGMNINVIAFEDE